jgi:hypothetical protein
LAEPVMFAYVLDQPAQREALRSEILERLAAIQALSQTMATAQLESSDPRSTLACSTPWPPSRATCAD